MIRIQAVAPHSLGAELGLAPGTELQAVNGRKLEDFLDWEFLTADDRLLLSARLPTGQEVEFDIERPEGLPMGVTLEPPRIRRCANHCDFCFVDGNPQGLRAPLYIRDDDYRLSFRYGNFATLTNLKPWDVDRIVEYRLSPLYVSVHATDPTIRRWLLRNPEAPDILPLLRMFAGRGIAFHTQVVLVPGVNDGAQLVRTLGDLDGLGPPILSVSVVPVALTEFSKRHLVREPTREDCRVALATVDQFATRALVERGAPWCYGADDLYLQAGMPLPPAEWYGDFEQRENGVGSVRYLQIRIAAAADRLPDLAGKRIGVVTGTAMGPLLPPVLDDLTAATSARFELVVVENTLFGPSVTTAGLLPAAAIERGLAGRTDLDFALLPAEATNDDSRFTDDTSADDLAARLQVPVHLSYDFVDALVERGTWKSERGTTDRAPCRERPSTSVRRSAFRASAFGRARMSGAPTVAIVGRPNVGKSTLFNRLIGRPDAIVDDRPGVTRDRHFAAADWNGQRFWLVDTGGLIPHSSDPLDRAVRTQVELAVAESDVVLFLVDVETGVHPGDLEIAQYLRKAHRPVILVANKADRLPVDSRHLAFYELGLGDPFPVSAAVGKSSGDLLDRVVGLLPASPQPSEESEIQVAVVGRPNVGKSSLVNRLLGEERLVVAAEPGTTRDAIDTPLSYHGRTLVFIDTAGLRKRSKVEDDIEFYSTLRTSRAIERADVCVLVVDAQDGMHVQDLKIANQAWEQGAAIIVAVNKWDMIEEKETNTAARGQRELEQRAPFLQFVPFLYVSAKTGQRVTKLLDLILAVADERDKRVPTSEVNRVLERLVERQQPPQPVGESVRLLYASQIGTAPPRFAIVSNRPDAIPDSYTRYLLNGFREAWQFSGSPVDIKFRRKRAVAHR